MTTPSRKPPHSVQVLQRWITEAERHSGVAVARQQRWVSYMVLAAMLDQVRDEDDQPLFLLKGGVALELRLGLQARATKDYDTAFRAEIDDLLDHLDEVLRAGHGDFTAERTALEAVGTTPGEAHDDQAGLPGAAVGERAVRGRTRRGSARP